MLNKGRLQSLYDALNTLYNACHWWSKRTVARHVKDLYIATLGYLDVYVLLDSNTSYIVIDHANSEPILATGDILHVTLLFKTPFVV